LLVFYDLCVIDLSKVSHCDTSGLAVLIGTGRRARLLGGFLRLAAVSPQVDQGLHVTGLRRISASSPPSRPRQPARGPRGTKDAATAVHPIHSPVAA
jgi:hypothetical protein